MINESTIIKRSFNFFIYLLKRNVILKISLKYCLNFPSSFHNTSLLGISNENQYLKREGMIFCMKDIVRPNLSKHYDVNSPKVPCKNDIICPASHHPSKKKCSMVNIPVQSFQFVFTVYVKRILLHSTSSCFMQISRRSRQ